MNKKTVLWMEVDLKSCADEMGILLALLTIIFRFAILDNMVKFIIANFIDG